MHAGRKIYFSRLFELARDHKVVGHATTKIHATTCLWIIDNNNNKTNNNTTF